MAALDSLKKYCMMTRVAFLLSKVGSFSGDPGQHDQSDFFLLVLPFAEIDRTVWPWC